MRKRTPGEVGILSQNNSILNRCELPRHKNKILCSQMNVDAVLHPIQNNKERNARLKGEMEIKSVLKYFP